MHNLCCGRRRWCAVCLWSLRNDKYSLGPGPVSILQFWLQNYFYISLVISTHRLPSAGTSCWNVAHYQSHYFHLLNRPLLADFMPFPAAKSCLQRAKKSSTYSSRHNSRFAHNSETASTVTRPSIEEHTNRSGRSSCRSASCPRCPRGREAGSPIRTWGAQRDLPH